MYVVATAGHVDHGKSTLVRTLTGMEPDRWAEERRRGMTIDLGYAWTTLPSGAQVAFVDVPGHERFMTNMLAGIGPVPAVLFVVAADEGWRAQSSEHLAALDLLGVRHGLLVVTRADLADPVPALREARDRLATTSLRQVTAVTVDSLTGRGFAHLRTALDRLVTGLPDPDTTADVRFWVDRVFTIAGAGTVVTGTLNAGELRIGDELQLLPNGARVRVRGLETLGERQERVGAVARVAVNLRRIGRADVRRGHALVAPDRWLPVSLLDGRVAGGFPAEGLTRELVLHIGSAAVPVRLRVLDASHVRLTLAHPLPLRIGDVALLRDPGQRLVVARMTVLDVLPPAIEGRGGAARRGSELAAYTGVPDVSVELDRRRLIRRGTLRAMGVRDLPAPRVEDWLVDPEWWRQAQASLVAAVEAHAVAHPADPGMPLETARRVLDLPSREFTRALAAGAVYHRDGRLYGSREQPVLPDTIRWAVERIRAELARTPFAAPDAARLAELGLDASWLGAAVAAGQLLRVADGVYLLPDAEREALRRLAGLAQPFTVGAARSALGSTRRVVVPLLELLERQGRTERINANEHRIISS